MKPYTPKDERDLRAVLTGKNVLYKLAKARKVKTKSKYLAFPILYQRLFRTVRGMYDDGKIVLK